MSRREEFVGVRAIDHVTSEGSCYGQWLTDEPIVRCRDCERFAKDDSDHDFRSGWWCKRWNTDMVKPDGFCAWGKRRKLADGGVVPKSYIRTDEEGSICPVPKASVTFEGQKLTFDAAESKEFLQLVTAHFRRIAGVEEDE